MRGETYRWDERRDIQTDGLKGERHTNRWDERREWSRELTSVMMGSVKL